MWNFNNFEKNTAYIDEYGNQMTYAELVKAAAQFLTIIPPRSLVFTYCENTPGSLIGYVSFLSNRIVPLLLDANLESGLSNQLIEIYQPSWLWVPAHKEIPGYETVFSGWGYNLLKTGFQSFPLHEELALLVTTSGSTGSPKLVRQSYQNIRANTESIVEYLKIDQTERPITTLPMNYVYGTSIINTHLSQGATVLLTTKGLMQKEFWQFFKNNEATSIAGVPYTYEMLKKLRLTNMSLPSLRSMTQAGGKLAPDLHKEFAGYAMANHLNFVIMYGAAEATARMGYLPPEQSLAKYGSMGIAIPGGRFELVDESDRVIEKPDIVGELVYYGDNITQGYAECREDLQKGDERHGRYATGDMAVRDSEGYYSIVGRKKRFLKIFGNRVGLDETERLLNSAFPDCECACGGVDDKMTVYITDDSAGMEIIRFLAEKTGINRSAFNVVAVGEIPRNQAGKILYSELGKL